MSLGQLIPNTLKSCNQRRSNQLPQTHGTGEMKESLTPSRIKQAVEAVGLSPPLEVLKLHGPVLEMTSFLYQNKCSLTVVLVTATVDGSTVLSIPSSLKEETVWKLTTPTPPVTEMVASLTNPKLSPPSVDTKRFLEISMLIQSTKMDLILSTFMPPPTSNTTAVESLTMNLAPNSLTIMPSLMLDTAPAKDTGPSETHGP